MAAKRPPASTGAVPPGLRHDLLNALNAVLGYATFLVEDLPEGPQREFALRLQRAGQEAQRLAEQLPRAPRQTRAILMVSAAADSEAVLLQLDALGFDGLRAASTAELQRALVASPSSWLAVLADAGQDLSADVAGTGVPVLVRAPGETAASLAARLESLVGT